MNSNNNSSIANNVNNKKNNGNRNGNKQNGNKQNGNKQNGNKRNGNKQNGNKRNGNKQNGNKWNGNKRNGNKRNENNNRMNNKPFLEDQPVNKMGIVNTQAEFMNPLTGQQYSEQYKQDIPIWTNLPMYEQRDTVIEALKTHQVVLMELGTGAGKTVLVPKYALHATGYRGRVVSTNPKQIPSKENAVFASRLMDVELGGIIGYRYRGSKLPNGKPSYTKKTQLLFSTDGAVVAEARNDPLLSRYDYVIIDEAHERAIQIDLLLLLMKNAMKLNPKLHLVIMSATLSKEVKDKFRNYFKDFKYKEMEGKGKPNKPIENIWADKSIPADKFVEEGVNVVVDKILKGGSKNKNKYFGDTLFFVTSGAEAHGACLKIDKKEHKKGQNMQLAEAEPDEDSKGETPFCVALYSGVHKNKQELAQNQHKYRELNSGPHNVKIVVGTNVAESSLTIDGLVNVVESGWALEDGYDPIKMMNTLDIIRIAKAQSTQRCGRAGRTQAGNCFRLYTEQEFEKFPEDATLSVHRNNLTWDLLEFMTMDDVNDVNGLRNLMNQLMDPPKKERLDAFIHNLENMGFIGKDGKLTPLVEFAMKFGRIEPPLAIMVLYGFMLGVGREISDLAAILSTIDGKMSALLENPYDDKEKKEAQKMHKKFISAQGDHITILNVWRKYRSAKHKIKQGDKRQGMYDWARKNYIIAKTLDKARIEGFQIFDTAKNLISEFEKTMPKNMYNRMKSDSDDKKILFCIKEAFKFQIAIKDKGKNTYTNVFPKTKTTASISRDSSLGGKKTMPRTIVYYQLQNLKGNTSYNICSKV